MFSIIGSVIGLVTSVGPGMFNKWMEAKQDTRDKAHELKMQKQVSADKRDQAIIDQTGGANIAIQDSAKAVTTASSQWVIDLAGTVRPLITYVFFFEFVILTVAVFAGWIDDAQFESIWSDEMKGIFATIIAFYFGQRLQSKWAR